MISVMVCSLVCALPPARPVATPSASDAAPAQQVADEELQQRIATMLGTIDTRISADEWRALGPRGAAILEQLAQDPKVLPSRRAGAVAGLSAIGASSSSSVLLGLARSEAAPLAVRLAAVLGTAGVIPPAQLGAALRPVLEGARNGQVRGAAAEVLSRNGGCSFVRAQASRESDPMRMQRALERCNQK
jgi:hypothetical protein